MSHPCAPALLDVLLQSEGMKLLNETHMIGFAVVMGKCLCEVLTFSELNNSKAEGKRNVSWPELAVKWPLSSVPLPDSDSLHGSRQDT